MGQLLNFLHERYKTKKRRCNYTSEPDDHDIDRISNLPDELLVHILAFLRIKEAVQTCVLSKRWKKTWASLPILFFDLQEFLLEDPHHKLSDEIIREQVDKFEKFVKSVLQNREASDLSHFILSSVIKDSVSCNGLLLRALEFKPRILSVMDNKLLNSNEIFTCASLQEVFLASRGDHNIEIAPNSVHLPHLKILYLLYVKVNDDFLDKLFFGCPIVEELVLYGCILKASRISSGRLKSLALFYCDFSKRFISRFSPCCEFVL